MAELALHDRLQPALLDRLLDDERTIALVRVLVDSELLERIGLPLQALVEILTSQGLRLQGQESEGNRIELRFTARAHASPAQLRALVLRPPRAPEGVPLQSLATIESTAVPNTELESTERRMLSRAKLRECVYRDLGWLFNSLSLGSSQDLSAFPAVASSVLNFGLPSFAGRMASSIDPLLAAEQLRRTVELFEPRLRAVRVTPSATERHEENDGTLEFTIEAELWGQPTSQHLELRTKIDMLSGDIEVVEPRGG
jgi:type VI secretion system protein ImpF